MTWAGELRLPAILSDHAVLQRGPATPVWGKAAPGTEVSITLGELRVATTADGQGNWRASLDLTATGAGPFRMVFRSGSDEAILEDVVVGEVWLASGQSNMAMVLQDTLAAKNEIANSANAWLRQFKISGEATDHPAQELQGSWVVASPQRSVWFSAVAYYFAKNIHEALDVPVGIINSSRGSTQVEAWISRESIDTVPALAAAAEKSRQITVGYPEAKTAYLEAFSKWLEHTGRVDRCKVVPESLLVDESITWETVTLPQTPSGPARPGAIWLRTTVDLPANQSGKDAILQLGTVHGFEEIFWNGKKIGGTSPAATEQMIRPRSSMPVPAAEVRTGTNDLAIRLYSPVDTPSLVAQKGQLLLNDISLAGDWQQYQEYILPPLNESEAAERPPVPELPPQPARSYSKLFNAMIHPLAPYGLAGVIWYQGEANVGRSDGYRTAFPLLIKDWRILWNREDLPFYWVQLPGFRPKSSKPELDSAWADLREAQSTALALPFTGQAVTLDLGEANDIHPVEKAPVGHRLAAIALAKTYGQEIPFQGPVFESARFIDGTAEVSFADAAGGLVAMPLPEEYALSKIPPQFAPLVRNSPTSELEGFELAGEDGIWYWADARIDDSMVVVSSAAVPAPRAVRYAWSNNPTANLWGKNGFPAAPFRAEALSETMPSP